VNLDCRRLDTALEVGCICSSIPPKVEFEEQMVRLIESGRKLCEPAGAIRYRQFRWYAEHNRPLTTLRFTRL
jgi:hypothetical protein